MDIKIDTEFQAFIPPLSPEERQGLEENIKQYGCRQPLDIWQDIIVDGHNRYEICQRLNIPFRTNSLEFPDRNAAKIWIIRNQFDRRNLSAYNRSVLALKMEDVFKEQAKANQQEHGNTAPGRKAETLLANLPKVLDPIPSLELAVKMAEEGVCIVPSENKQYTTLSLAIPTGILIDAMGKECLIKL